MTQANPTSRSALLVTDVQTDLFAEPQAVYDGPAVLALINGVIEQARCAAVPIIFVQDGDVTPVKFIRPSRFCRQTCVSGQGTLTRSIRPAC